MKVIDIIEECRRSSRSRFAVELLPPLKGDGANTLFRTIDALMEYGPSYITVTHHREEVEYVEQNGRVEPRVVHRRPGTMGISAAIAARYNIEVVPHIICGGSSRYEIEDDLIELDFLGISNVLALRGDNLPGEKSFKAHPMGHSHASELVSQIADLNRGMYVDSSASTKGYCTNFCVGVAGYPEKHSDAVDLDSDIAHLKNKVDAGADYIVTQMSFDNAKILDFMDLCRNAGIQVPIIPGIKPLSTIKQITLLPQIFGVEIPEELSKAVLACKSSEAVKEVGIQWAIEQSRGLIAAGAPKIHYYTMSRIDRMANIVKAVF